MLIEPDTIARVKAERELPGYRLIVAIAAAPDSGKSTFADALRVLLNQDDPSCATAMPMGGYHLDNAILTRRARLDRKGAPKTITATGLPLLWQGYAQVTGMLLFRFLIAITAHSALVPGWLKPQPGSFSLKEATCFWAGLTGRNPPPIMI